MNIKRGALFLLGLGMIFLFVINVSAEYFQIVPAGTCDMDKTVMTLSGATNAHGAVYNYAYPYMLCANFTGTHVCNAAGSQPNFSESGNDIVALYSLSNSHASTSDWVNGYFNKICFGNLVCTFAYYNPSEEVLQEYPMKVLSLSHFYNAHLGGYNDYPVKILCKDNSIPNILTNAKGAWLNFGSSVIQSATFGIESIPTPDEQFTPNSENSLKLRLNDTGLPQGTAVTFKIWISPPPDATDPPILVRTINGAIDSTGKAVVDWTLLTTNLETMNLENGGTTQLYFSVTAQGVTKTFSTDKLLLTIVGNVAPPITGNGAWINFAQTQEITDVTFDLENLLTNPDPTPSTENSIKTMYHNVNLPIGTAISFDIYKDNGGTSTYVKSITSNIDENHYTIATWTVNENDLETMNLEHGGTVQLYFVAKSGTTILESFHNKLLTMNIFSIDSLSGQWLDYYNHQIESINFYEGHIISGISPPNLNSVKINVGDGIPDGTSIYAEILEKDVYGFVTIFQQIRTAEVGGLLSGTVQNGEVTIPWIVSEQDLENGEWGSFYEGETLELYFNIWINGVKKSFSNTILDMQITPLGEPFAYWAEPENLQQITTFSYTNNSNTVGIVIENSEFNPGSVQQIQIKEEDSGNEEGTTDDTITTITGNVNSEGKLVASWTMSNASFNAAGNEPDEYYEFYFKAGSITGPILGTTRSQTVIPPECQGINYCSDYTDEDYCNEDHCDVAYASNPVCDEEDITCSCFWDETNEPNDCQVTWNTNGLQVNGTLIGTCTGFSTQEGDCTTDEYLTINYHANWVWNEDNVFDNLEACINYWRELVTDAEEECVEGLGGKYHYDPISILGKRYSELCANSVSQIPCPSQLQLPFGTWFNWFASIIVIFVIYYLIYETKKKRKRNK